MNRAFFVSVLFAFMFSACGKPAAPGKAGAGPGPNNDGWLVYEDDVFRVSYPPGSNLGGAESGKQDPARPSLGIFPPPAVPNTVQGGLGFEIDSKTKGMLLRDALQSDIREETEKGGVLVFGNKEFKVANGRCLGAVVVSSLGGACRMGQGTCYTPFYHSQCDAPDGRRYRVFSILSSSQAKNALGPDARREAAVYERIMNSLEFKKP